MKYHIFIATTQGVVAIQDIIPLDDPDIQSLITVNGTATLANISHYYHHFVKKGSGLIHQDFGCCSYRANIKQGIDQGNSWQLAMYLAHVVAQKGLLGNGSIGPDDQVFIATGEVNTTNRTILPITKILEKYSKIIDQYADLLPKNSSSSSTSGLPALNEKTKPIFFMHQINFDEIQSVTHHENENVEQVDIEAFVNLSDVVNRIDVLLSESENSHTHHAAVPKEQEKLLEKPLDEAHIPASDITALDELESIIADDILVKSSSYNLHDHQTDNVKFTMHEESEDEVYEETKTLKVHRNSFDEDKDVENALNSVIQTFHPKHLVLRVVGLCGLLLFVTALLLTYIKDKQSTTDIRHDLEDKKEHHIVLGNNTDNAISNEKDESNTLFSLQKTIHLVSSDAKNDFCDVDSQLLNTTKIALSDNSQFAPLNRHKLCQLKLITPSKINQVYWLDNNKAKVTGLTHVDRGIADGNNSQGMKEWAIPLPHNQSRDLTYFLVVLVNETDPLVSHSIMDELTAFVQKQSQSLKLTYQDLSVFLKDRGEHFLLYQHKLEVF